MKYTGSAVSTTIAELPVKLVRYRILGSDVTTSASSPREASCSRTAWWRRLSAGLGACDMDGVEPLLKDRDHLPGLFPPGGIFESFSGVGALDLDGFCLRLRLDRGRRRFRRPSRLGPGAPRRRTRRRQV